ncbi:MAG: LemA family protein [Candidatus Pacebacteria bacterium CG10_big_fil_rev_8_21_14_0_10_56_10]|nr:MAG: LemA family protein [Candidatus Pacebacteria bacterium CG10_big_fil_rev_8_21_14_0_10_56_10]
MSTIFIIAVIVAAVIIYIVSIYNGLQALKTQIKASIQEIGNQLKRQASLIPNLATAVKRYLKQEKEIFELLTEARKSAQRAERSGSAEDIDQAISSLQSVLPRISVAVEDNPEIKSDQTVGQFMNELRDTADKLMYARRSLIDLTQSYNVRLVTFPSSVIANTFGFQPEKGLETAQTGAHVQVSSEEMKDVKVDLE